MGRGLQNYPNTSANNSEFPDRRIRDNNGTGNGTPFDEQVYGDIHQVLAKLLRMAKIIANGDEESEYNGFQYIDAMQRIFGRDRQLIVLSGALATHLIDTDYSPIVFLPEDLVTGHIISLINPNAPFTGRTRIINDSAFSVDIFTDVAGGPANINGNAPPYNLPAGRGIELTFDVGGNNWDIVDLWKLA